MNRMSKILAIGCSLWSLMYLSAVAQDNMDLEAAPATVEDLDIAVDAEVSTVELIDSDVSNDQRVADAADLAEQERVRLQSEAREGRLALSEALNAMQNGQWTRAVDLFGQAQSKMKDVDMFKDELAMARDQKSEAYFQMARGLYDRRRQGGDLKQAEKYLKLAAETNPGNGKVEMLEEDIKDYYLRQETGREEIPIAKEEKYKQAKKEIDRLLLRGRKELEIGDYDEAEETFEKVLAIDRYNRSALRFIEKLTEERWEVYREERNSSAKKMMSMVEKSWLVPLKVDQRGPKEPFEATTGGLEIIESDLENKLNNIVIDEIDYRQAQIGEVIASLVDFSQQLDPDGIGVNIIFLDPSLSGAGGGAAPAAAPVADPFGFGGPAGGAAPAAATSSIQPITLRLRNVTLLDALRTVTEISGLYYRVDRNMVIIEREGRGRLITRFYPVDPTRWIQVQNLANTGLGGGGGGGGGDPFGGDPFGGNGGGGGAAAGSPDLTGLFTRYGVVIPEGGDIAYENLISQLVVTLTPDQFPQFEEVLRKINVAPRQVEIEARFVEVLQSDLEELGFEWILTDDAEILVQDGPGAISTRPRIQADQNLNGLTGGLRFFDFNSTSNSTTPTTRSGTDNSFIGDILSFSGILTNPELQMVIQAVDQNGNTDLLSAPRVTTVHGVNAIIEVVEEIIYPTEFDITENDVDIDGGGDGDNFVFIPPTVEPGGFETRNIGVILNVTPTVNADNYTINLVMLPEIAELVDWLQYGSSIPLGDGTEYIVNIPQPVFASRNLTTSMIVWDGHTVVMGGLIREELTTFEDKVPLLGDIPILGRLFRSEGRRSEKRNLLIFVTARLVDPAGNSVNAQDRQDLVTGASSMSSRGAATPMN